MPPPPPPPSDPKKKPAPKTPNAPSTAKFRVTLSPETPPGIHEVRLVNKLGVSNPRAFVVGDLAEVQEKEPNDDVPQAQRVDLNTTINGVIANPTDVDYAVFSGKKGQRVLLSCLAASIDSRLEPGLELYDSSGKWLGANRNYQDTDALLDCTLPADGDYYVRLFQFTYTEGNAEHFYRLSITTAPWIDAVYPPLVEPGKPAHLTVYGRNLPGGTPDPAAVVDGRVLDKLAVTVTPPSDPAALQRLDYHGRVPPPLSGMDGFEYRLHNEAGTSNPYLLAYAQAPVVLDKGANDTPETAQAISLPCEIAGRIEKSRDRDWYSFTAHKGEIYSIEVYGERLGSATDLYFSLRNPATKQQFGEFDDNQETLDSSKFFTRTEDPPRFRFVVPADGTYQLLVASRDADTHPSPRLLYRVRLTPELPDFRLVAMPEGMLSSEADLVGAGGSQYYDVYVWRQDGWNGPLTLNAVGLPAGVTCPPQVIGPGQRHGVLVVTATADASPWTGEIQIQGTALIQGRPVVRTARPASITWPVQQPNTLTISRLDRALMLAVRDPAPFELTAHLDKAQVLQGEKANLTLKLVRHAADFKAPLQVAPIGGQQPNLVLPPNVSINNNQPLTLNPGKDEGTAVVDVKLNAPPGTYTLVLRAQAPLGGPKNANNKQRMNAVIAQPSTPVTLTILPRQLATLSLASSNPTIKVGKQMEVVVKVSRMYDFAGEFKVDLVMPANVKGVSAAEVVIPAGQDEARLVVQVAGDAAPGNRGGLTVRATALFDGKVPTTQDAKFSVNVVK
ncbi:MAG: PPC domain-containing protein [Planctomycetes bacterium]|nr:PPC domain-containing protein [Planctomycetota bacterium]